MNRFVTKEKPLMVDVINLVDNIKKYVHVENCLLIQIDVLLINEVDTSLATVIMPGGSFYTVGLEHIMLHQKKENYKCVNCNKVVFLQNELDKHKRCSNCHIDTERK